jgi:hypothetical protein
MPKMFDRTQTVNIQEHKIDVYKGFSCSVKYFGPKLFLEVNGSSRLIRTDSVLDFIKQIK